MATLSYDPDFEKFEEVVKKLEAAFKAHASQKAGGAQPKPPVGNQPPSRVKKDADGDADNVKAGIDAYEREVADRKKTGKFDPFERKPADPAADEAAAQKLREGRP